MTNYRKAVDKGLLKILSKMGISLLTSYHGAQIFEALGIADNVIMSAFKGTSPPGSTCARSPSSIPSLPHRYHLHRSFSPHRHDIITLSSPLSSPPHLPTTLLILILLLIPPPVLFCLEGTPCRVSGMTFDDLAAENTDFARKVCKLIN